MPGRTAHVKNREQDEALEKQGMETSRAARIARRGGTHAPKAAAGKKGGRAAAKSGRLRPLPLADARGRGDSLYSPRRPTATA